MSFELVKSSEVNLPAVSCAKEVKTEPMSKNPNLEEAKAEANKGAN